jgi:FAD/FMN-containing dehydrogenase
MSDSKAEAEVFLPQSSLEEFRLKIRGEFIRPGDEGYETSRKVFNAMIERRPALIVRCAGTSDVVHGVNFARENGLALSVKGGGHSIAGYAVCDGGLMLDLSAMKGIRVDPNRRVANAQPGLTLGEFDWETQSFGLATPLGIVSVTGIAGLTLGGGIGWLNGRYGLACDNLISADVVTADGRLLTASDSENQDLFWAIRGGSGNFGVVASFTYTLHSVDNVLAGPIIYPFANAGEVLGSYHEIASACPDDLSTAMLFTSAPDGTLVVAGVVCWCGPVETGEDAVRPLRTFAQPMMDAVQPMPYRSLQSMFDGAFPPGRLHYWKAGFLKDLSEDAIDVLARFSAERPSPATAVGLQQIHGAAARVDRAATAFAHRDSQYDFLVLSQWEDPADTTRNIDWTKSFFEAMRPFLASGVYVNDLGQEGEERVKAAYGGNYDRLAKIKAKYDPDNVFRLNQNIVPARE